MFLDLDLTKTPQDLELFLAKPDRTVIAILSEAFDKNHTIKYGGINELEFTLPYDIDINHVLQSNAHIDLLQTRYLIKAKIGNTIEWYLIDKITDSMDDGSDIKKVHAFSLQFELTDKLIRGYSVTSYSATQVLSDALSSTIWGIGYIDADFDLKYRSFEVSNKTVLDLVLEIAETFKAVIQWDTNNRTVSLYKEESLGQNKGFNVAYGKYLKTLNKEEKFEDFCTRLKVFGKDNLSIQRINITGQNYIEDFSYFMYPFERDINKVTLKSSNYMSDSLCHAILDYQDKLATKQGDFDSLLSQKQTLETNLTTKENELDTLNEQLLVILDNLDVAKANGDSITTLKANRDAKQIEINNKQTEINSINSQITSIDNQIVTLRSDIAIETNFTAQQIIERSQFIIEKEWIDENYISDQDLYDDAIKRFDDIRLPQTVLDIDIINFLQIVECQFDWDKINIGDTVTVRYEKLNVDVKAKIIEVQFNYEDGNIRLTIANINDITNSKDKFLKTLYNSISTSTQVNMDKYKWNEANNKVTEINQIISDKWDATSREIVAGVNESVEITRKGLIIRDSNDLNRMLIAQHGVLALSGDGGETWKHAITPEGIIAERIFGKLGTFCQVTANQIVVGDGGEKIGSDLIDGDATWITQDTAYNGVVINSTNGVVVTRNDNKARILMNATDGLRIQGRALTTEAWVSTHDKFYADTNGNLIAKSLTIDGGYLKAGTDTLIDLSTKTIDFSKFTTINGKTNFIKGLSVTNSGGTTTFSVDSSGNVTINGNITMSSGSISWGNIAKPSYTSSEVGALSSSYSTRFTNITSTGVYTGTVEADQISGGLITGVTIKTASSTNFVELENQYIDFYNSSSRKIRIGYDSSTYGGNPIIVLGSGDNGTIGSGNQMIISKDVNGCYLDFETSSNGTQSIKFNNSGSITFGGTIDFTSATVLGVATDAIAKFA